MKEWACPKCGRPGGSRKAVTMHHADKHGAPLADADVPKNPKWLKRRDSQPSLAERMIDAQLQAAMGEPVDEPWLLDGSL